jgi:hypothetical protein
VSIGGYLANGTKQSNLTVNNYTGMVGIGTTTTTSLEHVNGTASCAGNLTAPYIYTQTDVDTAFGSNSYQSNAFRFNVRVPF